MEHPDGIHKIIFKKTMFDNQFKDKHIKITFKEDQAIIGKMRT